MMKRIKVFLKNKLILFVILLTVVFIFLLFYFSIYRVRQNVGVYVSGIVFRNIIYPNTGLFWLPYWLSDSIKENDKDYSSIGGLNAEVLAKETFQDKLNGEQVNLVLKLNSIKTRTGQLLYKNKPLTIGSIIPITLARANINLMITDINANFPEVKRKKIKINTYVKDLDPWLAESLVRESEIKSNKGETLIKLIDSKIEFAKENGVAASGQMVETMNKTKREIKATLELLVNEKNGKFYFLDILQIRPGQNIYVPWSTGDMNMTITEVLN